MLMEYLYWIFISVYVIVVVATIINVLMDNRLPVKTMAWVMVLAFMPVVGIVLYFFFGQDTRKEKLISQHSLDLLTKRSMLEFAVQTDLKVPDGSETLVKLFASQNWAMPFKDNAVDIYTTGYDFFSSLFREIGAAKSSIHLDTYIFDHDSLGQLLADMLIDKAQEGVEVRVIYDDVGCWNVHDSFFKRMRDAGIKVMPFMPVRFPAFTSKVNYRNHRKLCVIDGRVGFIGGMNVAKRYVTGTDGHSWRDTHLKIVGGAVYAIQRAFLIDWYFVSGTLITDRRYYPELLGNVKNDIVIQIVTSSPVEKWPDIMQGYVRILLEARRYVYIETPYFLPTETVMSAMRIAALAGVDVRIMIPRHGDAKFVEWASRSYVFETIQAGVKVYLYRPGFLHSKLLVCDDIVCTCGSTNVDFRSFENNFEANAFIYDRETTLRFKQIFMDDIKECNFVTERMISRKRPFAQRLWESVVRLLSPLL